jgi:hypothetical protein
MGLRLHPVGMEPTIQAQRIARRRRRCLPLLRDVEELIAARVDAGSASRRVRW